ncbi:MAG: radical SAM protein [Deltaproteobacteria bacterium]|nr:radical SAM protein [Deltaproteobacteria bacterium]
MKVLIVNPYRHQLPPSGKESLFRKTQLWDEEVMRDYGTYPLEVPYLGAILRKAGHSVAFIDAHQRRLKASEIDFKGFDCVIAGTAPYGNWRCAQFSYAHAVEVLGEAKNSGLRTITYGPHGTVAPATFGDDIDCIIKGEPEGSVVRALSASRKILELNEAELPQNLDDWTPLAFDLIDFDSGFYDARYIFEGRVTGRLGNLAGTRGCPFPCSFCFKVMIPDKLRSHTPQKVAEMASELVNRYGCKALNFNDLTFTLNKKWVLEVCERLKPLRTPYSCATRCDRMDPEVARALAESGCYKIDLGVESASDEVLREIKKGHSWEESLKSIEDCRKAGIPLVKVFQIFFTPGESPESVRETFKKMQAAGIEITPAICTPYPSTGLWKRGVEEGKLPETVNSWEEVVEAMSRNAGTIGNSFKRGDLEGLLDAESAGIRSILNKMGNEYGINGVSGVLKKGLKKIRRFIS